MIYAQIQNELVINTIIASKDDIFDPTYLWIDITQLTASDGTAISIGYMYDGNNFNSPPGNSQSINPTSASPVQVQTQIAESDLQPILSDIINAIVNNDPSFVQKYTVLRPASQQTPKG